MFRLNVILKKIIFRWTFSLCDILGSQIKSLWAKICNFYQYQEKFLWLWQDGSVSFIKISSKCNVEKNHLRWPFSFSEISSIVMKWLWAKSVISINIKKNYFDFDKMNLSVSSKFRQNVTLKKIIFDGLSVLVKY